MESHNNKEYEIAQTLERALNDYSWNPKRFAESTQLFHRTLQQTFMRTIVETIRAMASGGFDLRNKASHELCRKIVDSGLLDDVHLPFI